MSPVLILAALLLGQSDIPDAKDHPFVKRWPGSVITEAEARENDSFRFPVRDGDTKKVDGRYLLNIYRMPPKVTCAQLMKSYGATFKSKGLVLHSGVAVPAEDVQWANGKWLSA